MVQRPLEVGHRDALVDDEALDLVEDGGVRRVELIGAVDPARADHVDGQLALEHRAGLHRRGVRAQHDTALGRADEEGVLHGARGMVGGDVQGVEVEPLGLDLGALGDLVAHRDEHVLDTLHERGQRVPGSSRATIRGKRDVDRLLHEHALVTLGGQDDLAVLEGLLDRRTGHAHALARLGLRRRGQRTDLTVGQGQRRAVAGMLEADGLQGVEIGRHRRSRPGRRPAPRRPRRRTGRSPRPGHRSCWGRTWPLPGFARLRATGPILPGARRARASPAESASADGALRVDRRSGGRCRACAYRHTAAAVARLRLSARPRIGIRMTWSTAASTSSGRPWASLPSTQAIRPAEQPLALGGEQVGRVRRDVRGQGPVAGGPQGVDRLQRLARLDDRQVEQRPGRGAHALGVRRVDRAGRQGHARGPGRVGHADQGAGVARVGHLMGEHDLAGTVRSRPRRRAWPAPSDRPRRLPAGSGPRRARRTPRHRPRAAATPDGTGGRHHLVATIDPVLVDEHLDGSPGGQGLTDRLRALGQEHARGHAGTWPP